MSTRLPGVPVRHARAPRRVMRLLAAGALLAPGLAVIAPAAQAATVSAAVFTGGSGTVSVGGMLYAKQGGALTLTVTTDSAARCVEVGGFAATATSTAAKTSWVFTGTAPAGNGLKTYAVTVGESNNGNGSCTKQTAATSASYTLDNAGPVVTATRTPAPNAAGWNNSNVSWTWSATDAGSGVASGPTPASGSATANQTDQDFTATATDRLGNAGTGTTHVMLDKTAPTITGSRTPAANASGWNSTDVTVSFSCADATPGSGVKSCTPAQTLTSSGSVTGTAVDNADNSTSTAAFTVKIDKTAPTLSGAPTTSPNAAGWYRSDVTVHWTAADPESGVVAVPADGTIGGEGTALTAAAGVTNTAGLSTSATSSPAVRIDRTAPVTVVTAPPAWNRNDVTLTLVANDALSGVATTYHRLDGGAQTAGTSVSVSSEGDHALEVWSVDAAGNAETPHTVRFGIDRTSPTIGHTQSPAANADGWNNGAVTVTFTCDDATSGIDACTGPRTVDGEGRNQTVTGTATDRAGNTATDPASVSIDTTPPAVTTDPMTAPNANGWYGDDVTVTYTASDALSGVKSQDRAHTFGEGAGQTDTATATDAAGNSASVTTPKVNVDTTAPTISGHVVGTPNADGWFDGDVTVHWTCADNLSGVVACPADSVVTGEGGSLSVSASVSDRAGHTATATVGGIAIDRTAPATVPVNLPSGWANDRVTIGLAAHDNLSDVEVTYYAVDGAGTPTKGAEVTIGTEGVHHVTYWSVDKAGNAEAARTFEVRIDESAPSITITQAPAANANGWNNTDVTVAFACQDQAALSGVAACSAPSTVGTEGKAQQVTGTATDAAGNSVIGTATVNLDKTAPTITGAPDRAPNADGWYRGDVTVSFDASDALSGIDSVTGPRHLGEGAGQSVGGTAVDNAGNTASTTVTGIDVDETAPTLSAAPTTAPNANGWYAGDVTLAWAADDALSGIAGDVPGDAVLSGEGEGLTASATVEDRAGNRTTASSAPVRIDRTAPRTDAAAPSGWVGGAAVVALTAHDALSGVEATHYRVDGGEERTGDEVRLTDEGTHAIEYYSVDRAGNAEPARTVTVRIDRTRPTISHALAPAANANGWNDSDVTVTFTCDDQATLSGVATCTAPRTVTDEGRGQAVTGTATDNAGNTATDTATVNLDRTPPAVAGSRAPAANADGWNNTDVTVHFDATDELSGVDSVTADTTVGEGGGQSVTGTAVDAAGNTATATVGDVNVDETAPTLSGRPTTEANAAGWYDGDVGIAWTADDDRSGIASAPANGTITGEGAGLKDTATVSDRAGNATTADSVAVNIDRTPPVTGANAPSGWNDSAVAMSLAAADGLSGVDATYYTVDGGARHAGTSLTVATEGVHTVRYWSVDNAGNAEAPHAVTVRIDLTKPTIGHTLTPAPNARGWNRTPVTVAFACTDALSGVATCPADAEVATDGRDQPVPGTAVDAAGNTRVDVATVSVDTVAPTVTGSVDRAANANGWYGGDVTVSAACADALSGIADCTAPVSLHEGAAQSVTVRAVDAAGNAAESAVGPVDVDETAPTLAGAATRRPNDAGWYRGDVTVAWTAADALSGIDGAGPADSTIGGEGTGLTATASVADRAGNVTSATSDPVRIDRTPPTTAVSDVSDWSDAAVTVELTAGDNLSGVAATYHRLDDGDAVRGTSVVVDGDGVHTLQVWSVDAAGNAEARKSLEVRIDETAPGIAHALSPEPNARGWNNGDVTVTFTCTDGGSGVAGCTAPVTKGEGAAQQVRGTATDRAGNSATDETTVNVDETAPTLSGGLSADPNAAGWFDAPVTVSFTCADQEGLSGLLSCPASRTLGEGADQSAGGTAVDAADNASAPFAVTGIDVDTTAPTLSGAATAAPNGNGWYRGDVTVRWTAADALSGLADGAPADGTIVGEGTALSLGASVSDKAGNTTAASVTGIRIDRHDPSTTAVAPGGWQSGDVTVKLTATDNLSGVAATYYTVDGGARQSGTSVAIGAEGTHQVAYWSVDRAGNTETAGTVTVLVDRTPPTITGAPSRAADANGWYRAPVTVRFDCRDAVSGVADCQPDAVVSAEGAGQSVTGTAVDKAGNRSTVTVGGIGVDTVAPVVTVGGIRDGAVYTLGAVPAARPSATDATSGLAAPASGTLSGGTASGVGTFTYLATATDRAGNVGTARVSYRVVYGFGTTLFLQPVNDTAHQVSLATSIFKAGQTVPMKLQLRDAAGQVVQPATAPRWPAPVRGSGMAAAVNESAYATTGDVTGSYRWDAVAQQYVYNWNTAGTQAGSYWRAGVVLDDGQTYYVNIGLR